MFLQSSYTTEYLSETNLIITQEDFDNKLTDLLQPIKSYLHSDQDLLTFSISRYCGGDTRLAFFAQWLMLTSVLTFDSSELRSITRDHLIKKTERDFHKLENYSSHIDSIVDTVYVPMQIKIMQSKAISLADDIIRNNPYLHKYLTHDYHGRVTAHEMRCRSFWLYDDLSLVEFKAMQGVRESFLYIGYPVLISLLYNFNQPESVVNSKVIKWVLVEDILKIISSLHQTGRGFELERMMYYDSLTEIDKLRWLSLSLKDQKKILLMNEEIQKQGRDYRLELHRKGTSILESIVLPDTYMFMLKDLLDWALSSNFVEEGEALERSMNSPLNHIQYS
jgi:hypothetical protein